MRRFVSMVLVCCFALLGSGVAQHWHRLVHESQTSGQLGSHRDGHQPPARHNDSDCPLCLQLHQPVFAVAWSPPLIGAVTVVGWMSAAPASALASLPIRNIVCRGPPCAH